MYIHMVCTPMQYRRTPTPHHNCPYAHYTYTHWSCVRTPSAHTLTTQPHIISRNVAHLLCAYIHQYYGIPRLCVVHMLAVGVHGVYTHSTTYVLCTYSQPHTYADMYLHMSVLGLDAIMYPIVVIRTRRAYRPSLAPSLAPTLAPLLAPFSACKTSRHLTPPQLAHGVHTLTPMLTRMCTHRRDRRKLTLYVRMFSNYVQYIST
jgi:hypothetical protein